jgi:HAD superfamily hydrolase (TIGR01509 family)
MRAVLFDLGNTLVSYYAAAEFAPVLRQCMRGCMSVLEPHARGDEEELFQRAWALNVEREDHTVWVLEERLRVLFGEAPMADLSTAFLEPIFATAVPDPDALSVLASLRARGVRTAIVSNTPWGSPAAPWRAELARHGLLDAVDAVVFCADVGYRKPHPAPIERALELLGVPNTEAVFVGDDPRWDVAGAKRAGVRPILLARRPAEGTSDSIPTVANLREVLHFLS